MKLHQVTIIKLISFIKFCLNIFFFQKLDSEVPYSSVSNITWRQGRQLLRQYLQEIGYTDTIIDVRGNRVRQILGLNKNAEQEENLNPNVNGNENNKRASENQGMFNT